MYIKSIFLFYQGSIIHLTLYHGQFINFMLRHEFDAAAKEDIIVALCYKLVFSVSSKLMIRVRKVK